MFRSRRRAGFLVLALLVVAGAPAGAGGAETSAPPLVERIDALLTRWNRTDAPGVIVAVSRGGETIFARGYGLANLEHGIPLSPQTVSESGSVAKQFTAAAVALLAVRGRLGLDDPIRRHLPELPVELAGGITVRMLLNHTSGLRDIHGLFDLLGRPSYSSFHDNAEVLRVMSRQRRLNFTPGAEYLYCNASYILATIIVERAGGATFQEFCARELFAPRGMRQTRWRDDFAAVVSGRATGYAPGRGGGHRIDHPYSNLVGNGGLLTTVGDLLRWNASLDDATGEWAEVVHLLQTRSRLNDGRELDYALGLIVGAQGGEVQISHGGATSGYRTFLTRFPARRVGIAVLANAGDFDAAAVARQVAALVLDLPELSARPRPEGPAQDLSAFAGLYHCAQTDDLVRLTARDGRLNLGGAIFQPAGAGAFTAASGRTTIQFSPPDSDAAARRFTLTTTNGLMTYAAVKAARPTPEVLAAYAGEYYSDELAVARTVAVRDDRLGFDRWPETGVTAEPTFADGFRLAGGWHATFQRDATGRVTGFTVSNGRCRHVAFLRR